MLLQWRHNEHDGVSNHQPHDCLLNRSFKAQIKENIKAPRHWSLCGEFTGDRWIPAQMASNAEMFPFDDVIMSRRIHGGSGGAGGIDNTQDDNNLKDD